MAHSLYTSVRRVWWRAALLLLIAGVAAGAAAGRQAWGRATSGVVLINGRPHYAINCAVDYRLLTLKATASIDVPATPQDPLQDVALFLYANASGVGGDDDRRKNLVVDSVVSGDRPLAWKVDGAVLHVTLPQAQSRPFTLEVAYHGVVPRAPAGSSDDLMGAMGTDISGLLGGSGGKTAPKPKNTDYGLYTYGAGILSLGSFWYPQLAVRSGGHWADEQPEGLGDVAYSVKSDYTVSFAGLPNNVVVAAPGKAFGRTYRADDVREFAVMMSEDYVEQQRELPLDGRTILLTSFTTKQHQAKSAQVLDIVAHALAIYSKRFGAYPYAQFKLAEAPLRGGAGGMEYSGIVGIASMLYGDLTAQLGGMTSTLDLPGADQLLKSMDPDAGTPAATTPKAAPKAAADDGGAGGLADTISGVLGQQGALMASMFEASVAHETAHQWWAIGVGSDSERHPFLDESLANWSSMLYFEDRYGKATAQKMIDLHLKTNFSMGVMLGGGDRPANLPTSAYTNNLQYGAVIYGKGALFYVHLRALMGDDAFFAGLRRYYAQYKDQLAGSDDLHRIMVQEAPQQKQAIDALYVRWIDQAHGTEDIHGGMGDMLSGLLGGGSGGGLDLNGLLGNLMGGAAGQ
jgi:hypothetical protein